MAFAWGPTSGKVCSQVVRTRDPCRRCTSIARVRFQLGVANAFLLFGLQAMDRNRLVEAKSLPVSWFSSLRRVVGLQTGFSRTMGVKEVSAEFERLGRLGPATFLETHDWG